jgi:hypothetical protein
MTMSEQLEIPVWVRGASRVDRPDIDAWYRHEDGPPDALAVHLPWRARRRLAVLAALLLLAAPAAARASNYIDPPPDYVASTLVRVGVTTEGRFLIGLSFDLSPATIGVDFSPKSALGSVRLIAGVKDGLHVPQLACSLWAGASAVGVYAFEPHQPGHFGVGIGVHAAQVPIASGQPPISFPQTEQGGTARLSWFPGAGVLAEGSFDLGLVWAPGGYCQSD